MNKITNPTQFRSNIRQQFKIFELDGVKIGERCVIGAGSVVTKSVESNCLVAGNPAQIIKRF